jgi:hypothetical protein
MYQLTKQDIIYRGYPIQCFSISSIGEEKLDLTDIISSLSYIWKQKLLYSYLNFRWKIDLSSIRLHFEIKNETSVKDTFTEGILEEDLFLEMVEHDYIVKMPPKRRYTIELDIKNIRRGEPGIFEIEDLAEK